MSADNLARRLACQRGDLPLQLSHSGFARVVVDQALECPVGQSHQLRLEAMLIQLARHQITLGDLEFFRGRITGQFDHFKPVAQRGMDRVEPVGGRDEEDMRQVEGHVEVVVGESIVLLRIEDLKQRGGRVSAKIRADLVNFIKQDDRIVALHPA